MSSAQKVGVMSPLLPRELHPCFDNAPSGSSRSVLRTVYDRYVMTAQSITISFIANYSFT